MTHNHNPNNEPAPVHNPMDYYVDAISELYRIEKNHTKRVRQWSWVFVAAVTALLGWTIFDAHQILWKILFDIRVGHNIPTDKVIVAIISIYAMKIIGLATILMTFFFRKHPHHPKLTPPEQALMVP